MILTIHPSDLNILFNIGQNRDWCKLDLNKESLEIFMPRIYSKNKTEVSFIISVVATMESIQT